MESSPLISRDRALSIWLCGERQRTLMGADSLPLCLLPEWKRRSAETATQTRPGPSPAPGSACPAPDLSLLSTGPVEAQTCMSSSTRPQQSHCNEGRMFFKKSGPWRFARNCVILYVRSDSQSPKSVFRTSDPACPHFILGCQLGKLLSCHVCCQVLVTLAFDGKALLKGDSLLHFGRTRVSSEQVWRMK